MMDIQAFQEFRAGLGVLHDGNAQNAIPHFRSAFEREPSNPFYLSYLGMALGAGEQQWVEAEKLCRSAVKMSRHHAQLYLNLAEVYTAADRKQEAADALSQGLRYVPGDTRLKMAISRLATRRTPVLSFLPRDHVVNRKLGKIRHNVIRMWA